MADTKITALTALTAADPANDVIPIVDVSDTTMAASGTTKKISVNNILGASGTATLASATITGDLTVDTSTLKVNSTNDRVGIGTASPGKRCEINQSANAITTIGAGEILRLIGDDGNTVSRITEVGFGSGPTGATYAPAIIGAVNISVTGFGTKDFYVATRSGTTDIAPLERLRVTAAGNVNITTGNVVMSTSGKGIDFSAVTGGTGTATANVLNDYEEGTFTPTIGGTAATGVGVYTTQTAKYTKIGNLVTFQIYLVWTAHTGTGNMRINGLPFTNGSNFWTASVGFADSIALTANSVMTALVESAGSFVSLVQYQTGGGASGGVPIDTAGGIIVSASYTV